MVSVPPMSSTWPSMRPRDVDGQSGLPGQMSGRLGDFLGNADTDASLGAVVPFRKALAQLCSEYDLLEARNVELGRFNDRLRREKRLLQLQLEGGSCLDGSSIVTDLLVGPEGAQVSGLWPCPQQQSQSQQHVLCASSCRSMILDQQQEGEHVQALLTRKMSNFEAIMERVEGLLNQSIAADADLAPAPAPAGTFGSLHASPAATPPPRIVVCPIAEGGAQRFSASAPPSYQENTAELNSAPLAKECASDRHLKMCTQQERQLIRDTPLSKCVLSPIFENTVMLAICLNTVFIGYSTEYSAAHIDSQSNRFIEVAEIAFHVFYISELSLRLMVWRLLFFHCDEYRWNIFDFSLAGTAVFDIYIFLSAQGENANVTFVRAFRLLKAVKILRMVRVLRFFRQLRMLLCSIVGSLTSLLWSMVMLLAVMYLGVLIFVQGINGVRAEPDKMTREQLEGAEQYWSSIPQGISTMWMAISGGADWIDLAEPLKAAGDIYFVIFELFMAFLLLAVLNILTGVFVEHAVEASQHDRDNVVFQTMKDKDGFVQDISNVFKEMDTDGTGTISWNEFSAFTGDPKLLAYLQALDIDTKDALFFFTLLSGTSLDGTVNYEMFLRGCERLKGRATMMDMQALSCQVMTLHRQHDSLHALLETQLAQLALALPPRRSSRSSQSPSTDTIPSTVVASAG